MSGCSCAALSLAYLRGPRRSHGSGGFSLVELLVTITIGLILMGGITNVITSHIRSNATAELSQRVRDDSNRLNYLIQTETSEAGTVGQGQPISGCTPLGGVATSIFNLNIPKPDGMAASSTNISTTYYYASAGDLRRCGPLILQNGSLNHAVSPIDSLVSSNATLVTNVPCQSVSSTNRQIALQVTFNDVPGGFQPACAIARAKSFLVKDPTDPS